MPKVQILSKTFYEYTGNFCYIPTSDYCFMRCINFLTGKDYERIFLDFARDEKRRSNIMTLARIQLFFERLMF